MTVFRNVAMKKFILLFYSLVISLYSNTSYAEPIKALTASLPPFSISAEKHGIAHDLVMEISRRSGIKIEIEYVSWKRAQTLTQNTPNTLIFAIGRTETREPLYKWVTELEQAKTVFVTTNNKINSFEEAQKLDNITVLANTPRERKLEKEGFNNYSALQRVELCARVLNGDRADAWYTIDTRAQYVFKEDGLDMNKLIFGEPTNILPLWLAAHPDFDQDVADKLSTAMESIKADGSIEGISQTYLK